MLIYLHFKAFIILIVFGIPPPPSSYPTPPTRLLSTSTSITTNLFGHAVVRHDGYTPMVVTYDNYAPTVVTHDAAMVLRPDSYKPLVVGHDG